jgi:hypothetical protein
VPPFILAERHIAFLNPSTNDVKKIAARLRKMQQAGIPQFRDLAPDPTFREVALSVAPIAANQVIWRDGEGHSYTGDPAQASLEFALGEARFVYAIRLTYAYADRTHGWATLRMSWGDGDRNRSGDAGSSDCEDGAGMILETFPHSLWSRRLRAGPQKSVTIWVNSMIDAFRICPDTKPFSIRLSKIVLLVPSGAEGERSLQ